MKTYHEWRQQYLQWFLVNHPESEMPREHVLGVLYDEYVQGARLAERVGLDSRMDRIHTFAVAQGWDDTELVKRIGLWLAPKLTLASELHEFLEYLANEEAKEAKAKAPVAEVKPSNPDGTITVKASSGVVEIETTIDGRDIYMALTVEQADILSASLGAQQEKLLDRGYMPGSPNERQLHIIYQLDQAIIDAKKKAKGDG